jgi:hypothetical protein
MDELGAALGRLAGPLDASTTSLSSRTMINSSYCPRRRCAR